MSYSFVCLFVTEVTRLWVKTGSERGSYANPLCQITAVTAESFAAPVLDVFLTPLHGLKSQHVMRDTALELGPPSGTGKLIPLLLDAGTSSCTRLPPRTDGIFPHLTNGHTSFTAQVWPSCATFQPELKTLEKNTQNWHYLAQIQTFLKIIQFWLKSRNWIPYKILLL